MPIGMLRYRGRPRHAYINGDPWQRVEIVPGAMCQLIESTKGGVMVRTQVDSKWAVFWTPHWTLRRPVQKG